MKLAIRSTTSIAAAAAAIALSSFSAFAADAPTGSKGRALTLRDRIASGSVSGFSWKVRCPRTGPVPVTSVTTRAGHCTRR